MRIAIIGAGISGIAAAKTLNRFGYQTVLFERRGTIGGVWALAYPNVRLQSLGDHYRLTDYDWPFAHDVHPTATEVLRYMDAAVDHFKLDVRLDHEVTALHEMTAGWTVDLETPEGRRSEPFDYVVVAAGHYTHEKPALKLPGQELFNGKVVTERDITDLAIFDGKRVVVAGFGKSAVDMAVFALERARHVDHVFRDARWLMPRKMMGRHIAHLSAARMSTIYASSWVHPGKFAQLMHRRASTASVYAAMVGWLIKLQTGITRPGRSAEARVRMKLVTPKGAIIEQLRGTLAPETYYPAIADGRIEPHKASVTGFTAEAVILSDGTQLPADIVVLATGFDTPQLPFLPDRIRADIAEHSDGVQLYRHMLHPRVPRLAFAGFNHNPLHIPAVEVATTWLGAVLEGSIVLPSADEMEQSTFKVRDWKRAHTIFEPTRAYWVSSRFHQYLDVLLMELGVKPNRKNNPLSEYFDAYGPEDYAGVFDEYRRCKPVPRPALPFDT